MVNELCQKQIDQVLYAEGFGRIGCHTEGRTYIVPTNYVYDGTYIYAHSINGMELQTMRVHPEVCFEVDQITDTSNWRSVIAWGTFEELEGEAATHATYLLIQRNMTMIASGQSIEKMKSIHPSDIDELLQHISVYRIHFTEKTGYFEKTE